MAKKAKVVKKLATAATATPSKKLNKSAFIREQPKDLPAKEIIEKAKKLGMNLSANFIYAVRASSARKAGTAGTGTGRRGRPRKVASASADGAPNTDAMSLVLAVGKVGAHAAVDQAAERIRATLS